MAVLSTMHTYNIDLIRQSQLAVAHGDNQHVPGTPETLPAVLLSGSDQPTTSLCLEDDNTSHLLSGNWHKHAEDFAPISQMAHVKAHGQPRTRGPKNYVWHCSECGDGPYSTWQVACQECGHKRCGSCDLEETS